MQFQNIPIDLSEGIETKTDKFIKTGNDAMENIELGSKLTPRKRQGHDPYGTDLYDSENDEQVGEVTSGNEIIGFRDEIAISHQGGIAALNEQSDRYNKLLNDSPPLFECRLQDSYAFLDSANFVPPVWIKTDSFLVAGMGRQFFVKPDEKTLSTKAKAFPDSRNFKLVESNGRVFAVIQGFTPKLEIREIFIDGSYSDVLADIDDIKPQSITGDGRIDVASHGDFLFIVAFDTEVSVIPDGFGGLLEINRIKLIRYEISTETLTSANILMQRSDPSESYNVDHVPSVAVGDNKLVVSYLEKVFNSVGIISHVRDFDLTNVSTQFITSFELSTPVTGIDNGVITSNIEGDEIFYCVSVVGGEGFGAALHNFETNSFLAQRDFTGGVFEGRFSILTKPRKFGDSWVIGIKERDPELSALQLGEVYRAYVLSFTREDSSGFDFVVNVAGLIGRELFDSSQSNDRIYLPSDFVGVAYKDQGEVLKYLSFDFERKNTGLFVEQGGASYVPGARPARYDGFSLKGVGFLSRPQIISASTGSGSLSAGVYEYVVVLTRSDAFGNIERSAPSFVFERSVGASSSVTVNFRTGLEGDEIVRVELFRRAQADIVFRVAGSTNIQSSLETESVTDFGGSIADARVLYTTGGILENDTPPAFIDMVYHNGRMFGINATKRNELWFSKPYFQGEGIGFNAFQTIDVEEAQGRRVEQLEALGSLDNYLILFKPNSILAITGEGPDATGANNSLTRPQLISTDTGCNNPRSVVLTNLGLMFQSSKGIYLLTRSLEVVYVGAAVSAFKNERVSSAVLMENQNQVRFTTFEGQALVFNYITQRWTTFKNYEAVSSLIKGGKHYHLKADGITRVENERFDDDGEFIPQVLTTGWMKLTGVQDFGRVQRILILGEYKGEHKLKVRVSYNYEEYAWDEYELDPQDANYNRTTKPDLAGYQDGENNGVYEWTIHLKRQKCESVKVSILDELTTTPNASFDLSSMQLRVGIKRGAFKMSREKKV